MSEQRPGRRRKPLPPASRWSLAALAIILAAVAILLVLPGERTPARASLHTDATRFESGPENNLPSGYPGFTRAEPNRGIRFPEDHGPHPDFLTEWWYYTGNLEAGDGRHYGYQLTFFRRALAPPQDWTERASDWGSTQAYLAHFAVTDVAGARFHSFERLSRSGAGLAGATVDPNLRVWLEDWSLEETGHGQYRLQAAQSGLHISLELVDRKGPVLQGQNGYSPKGPEAGNASHYISQTRLETTGILTTGGEEIPVHGWSWMDHEFSTSALSAGQVGWDWFALQMGDGSELMVFQLRREDGTPDPYSSGTYIHMDGTSQPLGRDDFTIEVLSTWNSPHSGAEYPSKWRITVPSQGLVLDIEPYLADQEHQLSTVYWEGAVQIQGSRDETPVDGRGYVELTGYGGEVLDF